VLPLRAYSCFVGLM